MFTRTFQHNGATITVARSTIKSRVAFKTVVRKLDLLSTSQGSIDPITAEIAYAYCELVTRCTVAGDIGFSVPTALDSEEDVQGGYEAFCNLSDDGFYEKLKSELDTVQGDFNDDALTPEKKTEATTNASDGSNK